MSETPATPEAEATQSAPETPNAAAAAASPTAPAETMAGELGKALKEQEVSIHSLLEAGAHFGHQPGRWNPLMKPFIFGERNGTHIVDLDQTLPLMQHALDFLRETTGAGGSVLFVGTKRQAAASIMTEARRAGQHYVNNRWLGGMLTNWKTVKKSIDRYNTYLEVLASEDKRAELSKKELSSMTRQVEKYAKSLEGIRSMDRPPSAIFIIDVGKEGIAVQEAKRLHIPIVGVVDTNCSPRSIDYVIPGNDDAIRAIDLYCTAVANACREGYDQHQAELVAQRAKAPAPQKSEAGPSTGRRVVEIKQAPRRSRGGPPSSGGGKAYTAGGDKDADAAPKAAAAPAAAKPAETPAAPTPPTPPTPRTEAPAEPESAAAPAAGQGEKTE
jgi:small subunit ribosomal protein S2